MSAVTGSCYCGCISYEVESGTVPVMKTFCHCISCRKAHGAPMYWVVVVPAEKFTIISGAEFCKKVKPDPTPIWDVTKQFSRNTCAKCGTRIFNEMFFAMEMGPWTKGEYRGIFPAGFDSKIPDEYRPSMHVYCSEAIIDLDTLKDGLPRFDKFPSP